MDSLQCSQTQEELLTFSDSRFLDRLHQLIENGHLGKSVLQKLGTFMKCVYFQGNAFKRRGLDVAMVLRAVCHRSLYVVTLSYQLTTHVK